MSNLDILKKYSLRIDFLDYNKRKDATANIVYSKGDRNTAFIYATLLVDREVLDLENSEVVIGIKKSEGENLIKSCEIIDHKEGLIKIPFDSESLTDIGFNRFEVVVYNRGQKMVSPIFNYRVVDSLTKEEEVEDSENYDVLLVLISQVQDALDRVENLEERVENLEEAIETNEEIREDNEVQRIENEEVRQSNEANRQEREFIREANEQIRQEFEVQRQENEEIRIENEEARQNAFDDKIVEIDSFTEKIENVLNDKVQEVDEELNSMIDTFDKKVEIVDGKIQEVDDKLVKVDIELEDKLNKFDSLVSDKIEETDKVIEEKLLEVDDKVDNKLDYVDSQLETKLEEVDSIIENKVVEIDTNISDIVEQFSQNVENKMSEIDSSLEDKFLEIDKEVEDNLNSKFDNAYEEIIERVDTTLEEKTSVKFEEVDNILLEKLLENEEKIDKKIEEADNSILGISEKIEDMNTAIEVNTEKVDNKILEIEDVKNQLVNKVDEKIVEVDETKEGLITSIDDKMKEFEDRFDSLESANPVGEITQSRISIDGTVHDSLAKRLTYDYNKKSDKDTVYTKVEIDEKIENITSVDDNDISLDTTWSSEKISSELDKKDSIEDVDLKLEGLSLILEEQIVLKADKDNVYSKDEIDDIVSNSTSIDDDNVSEDTTWSSNKTNKELENKIDKEEGKGLSSNDFSNEEKEKLEGLENYVHPDDENTRHITDNERETWNNKADLDTVYSKEEVDSLIEGATSIDDENISSDKTWSSEKISSEISTIAEDIPRNIAYDKVIATDEWIQEEDNNYHCIINHNLNTIRIFISAIDNVSKEAILIGYKILDNNNVKISTNSQEEVFVTIVNGNTNIQPTEDSDTKKNIAFDKEVSEEDWIEEDDLVYTTISHTLFTEKVFVSAITLDTKDSLDIAYKVISDATVKVIVDNPVNARITVLNGEKEFTHLIKEGTEIEDSVVSSGTTWSSKKIEEVISNIKVSWEDILDKPNEFNPSEHNHNDIYYQKEEVDTIVEPIGEDFIDGLFKEEEEYEKTKISNKYYTIEEIDKKFNMLISMIKKISK